MDSKLGTTDSLPKPDCSSDRNPVRFGILGCASIASKFARAVHLSGAAIITAVGSRSLTSAQRFLDSISHVTTSRASHVPRTVRAHGSYEAVIDDPCVDAVYVPLPTSMHARWAVAAAEKGKHVLLEKPAALNGSELERILDACGSNGVQFMDGSMWIHHPRTDRMKEVVSDAAHFGSPKIISCTSTFSAPPEFFNNNIRVKPDLDGLGALGGLGWYCIGAILWAVDSRLPSFVAVHPSLQCNDAGVILACSATFHWNTDDIIATFHCSFLSNVSMFFSVHGTNGSIQVNDLAIPYEESSGSFHYNSGSRFVDLHIGWSRKPEEVIVETDVPQEALMVREFARLASSIRDFGAHPDTKWPEFTRKTQMLVDAVMKSIELGFKPVEL